MRWRKNILLIAGFVFFLGVGIIAMLFVATWQGKENSDFVTGALIGLLGTTITALTAIGNNILEKDKQDEDAGRS